MAGMTQKGCHPFAKNRMAAVVWWTFSDGNLHIQMTHLVQCSSIPAAINLRPGLARLLGLHLDPAGFQIH